MQEIRAKEGIMAKARILVMGLFLFTMLGTGSELLLLEHTEDIWMWIPLVLMGTGVLTAGVYGLTRKAWSLRVFQGIMGLFIISGFVGTWLHYNGNAEFELEMYPAMKGFELFKESMMGASPALAPGAMIQLGLLGLLFTFKHPLLSN